MVEPACSSGRRRNLLPAPLPLRLLALLVISITFMDVHPVSADSNEPTSIDDCYALTRVFDTRISALQAQLPMCRERSPYEKFVTVPQCGHPETQSCAPLRAQMCALHHQKIAANRACIARWNELHAREAQKRAEEAQRRADEKRAEETRQREATELARAENAPMAVATGVQVGAVAGGLGAAAAGGVPIGLPIGALHLSNEFSAIGGAAANRIRMESILQLEDALTTALGMNTDGPASTGSSLYERRPTQAQIAYELDAPWEHAERAGALQAYLPFGGESAVVGPHSQHLTDLAYARANGTLTTPLSQTQIQLTISSPDITGGQGATLAIVEDAEPSRQAPESADGLLHQKRLLSLGNVEASLESERLAELERRRAEQQRVRERTTTRPRPTANGFSKPECADMENLISIPGHVVIDNNCSYSVSINLTNDNFSIHGRNLHCGGAVVIPPGRSTNDYGVLESQIRGCIRNITAQ